MPGTHCPGTVTLPNDQRESPKSDSCLGITALQWKPSCHGELGVYLWSLRRGDIYICRKRWKIFKLFSNT